MKTVKYIWKHECKQADFFRILDKITSVSSKSRSHLVIKKCVECLTIEFKSETSYFVDVLAPLITKTVNVRDVLNEWYDADMAEAQKKLRNAERNCLISRTSEDLQE